MELLKQAALKEEKEDGAYSFKELVSIAKENGVILTGYRITSLKDIKKI